VVEHFKHLEYPIIKDPKMLYFVGKDGYIYSVPLQRGARRRKRYVYESDEIRLLREQLAKLREKTMEADLEG
jgi:hypothetical protein